MTITEWIAFVVLSFPAGYVVSCLIRDEDRKELL